MKINGARLKGVNVILTRKKQMTTILKKIILKNLEGICPQDWYVN